ncbi:MAG: T9SS type A sorting domain-containing protein, partial [Calditrichales bacterium]|nr:T9SS type A sorting domain-containing protein [Calditrichales bacterium]
DILNVGANANFYMLWACGNSRYVEDNYCGGVYALKTINGINSIGTTHSGGMTDFAYFYDRLAEGVAYGEAFLLTLQYAGEGGFDEGQKGWYYGITFNGDPFIIPKSRGETGIVRDDRNQLPTGFNLGNYPNPFNPATTISYRLPTAGVVELTIYSILGEKVQTLLNIYQPDGYHKIIWDGMNAQGVKAPSGIYIYRLTSGKSMISKKMVLIK